MDIFDRCDKCTQAEGKKKIPAPSLNVVSKNLNGIISNEVQQHFYLNRH